MANATIKQVLRTSYVNFAAEAFRRFPTKADVTAVDTKVDTLIGSDTGKSARTIATEELAAQLIPASAQEALDTLQEIAAWIQSHPAEAAAINAKLTLGTHEVGGEQVQYETVKAYVEAYVADQISASELDGSNAISVSEGAISLILDTLNANGLEITASGLKLGLASSSANGALSSTDYAKFNAKQEQVVVPTATGTGNVITGATLNADNKTFEFTKGLTALQESDFEAFTAAEVTAIYTEAKAIVDAE